jgi:hypothetical protein
LVLPGISNAHEQIVLSELVLQKKKMNTGIALKVRETVCKHAHLVGLHCHEVVHGEIVLGDRALPMVLRHQNQTKSAEKPKHTETWDESRAGKRRRTSM